MLKSEFIRNQSLYTKKSKIWNPENLDRKQANISKVSGEVSNKCTIDGSDVSFAEDCSEASNLIKETSIVSRNIIKTEGECCS